MSSQGSSSPDLQSQTGSEVPSNQTCGHVQGNGKLCTNPAISRYGTCNIAAHLKRGAEGLSDTKEPDPCNLTQRSQSPDGEKDNPRRNDSPIAATARQQRSISFTDPLSDTRGGRRDSLATPDPMEDVVASDGSPHCIATRENGKRCTHAPEPGFITCPFKEHRLQDPALSVYQDSPRSTPVEKPAPYPAEPKFATAAARLASDEYVDDVRRELVLLFSPTTKEVKTHLVSLQAQVGGIQLQIDQHSQKIRGVYRMVDNVMNRTMEAQSKSHTLLTSYDEALQQTRNQSSMLTTLSRQLETVEQIQEFSNKENKLNIESMRDDLDNLTESLPSLTAKGTNKDENYVLLEAVEKKLADLSTTTNQLRSDGDTQGHKLRCLAKHYTGTLATREDLDQGTNAGHTTLASAVDEVQKSMKAQAGKVASLERRYMESTSATKEDLTSIRKDVRGMLSAFDDLTKRFGNLRSNTNESITAFEASPTHAATKGKTIIGSPIQVRSSTQHMYQDISRTPGMISPVKGDSFHTEVTPTHKQTDAERLYGRTNQEFAVQTMQHERLQRFRDNFVSKYVEPGHHASSSRHPS